MTGFWAKLPAGRVVHLVNANPEAVELALDPLPTDAPAVVTCDASVAGDQARTVAAIIGELEKLAIVLYPAWLPGAEGLNGRQGARAAAVRSLALRKGAATPQFGPFLADLAVRSLRMSPNGDGRLTGSRFAAEIRAAGLARVIADSFRRAHTALLVRVPDGLAVAETQALVAASEWLSAHGGFGAWLAGADLTGADRLLRVEIELPARLRELSDAQPTVAGLERDRTVVRCVPLSGRPAPGSAAETALEAALATRSWAVGRVWNRTYRTGPLAEEIRVDLMWEPERCAVELDGPEHRTVLHYEADRRRDVQLQLAGFAVLRFTNEQVEHDVAAVLAHIEQLITSRRNGRA